MISRRKHGFTLVEILISLTVLTIGLVGILALFPVGLDNSKKAILDTTSANIAESVKSAIVQALRLKASGTPTVEFYHDGVSTGLTFELPETDPIDGTAGKFERTIPLEATAGASAKKPVFYLGDREKGSAAFPFNIKSGNDRDQQLKEYAFDFKIRPTTSPAVKNTYEVLIRVYRNYPTVKPPINTFSTIINTSPTK